MRAAYCPRLSSPGRREPKIQSDTLATRQSLGRPRILRGGLMPAILGAEQRYGNVYKFLNIYQPIYVMHMKTGYKKGR